MKNLLSIGLLIGLTTALLSSPAHADTAFGISVSQTNMVTRGQVISVKVNNLPADKGIYIRECVLNNGIPDTSQCTSMQSNPQSVLWVTSSVANQSFGGANPAVAQSFTLVTQIGQTSCVTNTCGLVTSRDHVDFTDRSLDGVTPLTFSALTPTVDNTSNLVDASDSVSITLTGLDQNQGVYVRLCAAGNLAQRPTACFGQGIWASNNQTSLTQGGTDASSAITLAVRGNFAVGTSAVDCQLVSCGVFIRLDHLASSDTSLDTFIPVTFAAPVKVGQSVAKWLKIPALRTGKVGQGVALAMTSTKTQQGSVLTWKSLTPTKCVTQSVSGKVLVKLIRVGRCSVVASAKSSNRLFAKSFTWSFSVTK